MNTSHLALGLALLSLSCQTKPKQENTTVSTTSQGDSAALLAKRPGPDAPRSAADRLVRALYFEHNKTGNPFREKKDRTLIDQFFAKSTSDLIWTQAVGGKSKVLTGNLLFNAPDVAIHKTWVEPAAVGGTRAVVYVTFQNKGKAEELRLDLQQYAGRWRITDILYPNGKRLTQLLQGE